MLECGACLHASFIGLCIPLYIHSRRRPGRTLLQGLELFRAQFAPEEWAIIQGFAGQDDKAGAAFQRLWSLKEVQHLSILINCPALLQFCLALAALTILSLTLSAAMIGLVRMHFITSSPPCSAQGNAVHRGCFFSGAAELVKLMQTHIVALLQFLKLVDLGDILHRASLRLEVTVWGSSLSPALASLSKMGTLGLHVPGVLMLVHTCVRACVLLGTPRA